MAEKKAKPGQKVWDCPKCKKGTPTTRADGTCKVCGTVKPKYLAARKDKTATPRKPRGKPAAMDLRQAVLAVKELGGVKRVEKLLEQWREVSGQLAAFGGIEQAKQALQDVETLKGL